MEAICKSPQGAWHDSTKKAQQHAGLGPYYSAGPAGHLTEQFQAWRTILCELHAGLLAEAMLRAARARSRRHAALDWTRLHQGLVGMVMWMRWLFRMLVWMGLGIGLGRPLGCRDWAAGGGSSCLDARWGRGRGTSAQPSARPSTWRPGRPRPSGAPGGR